MKKSVRTTLHYAVWATGLLTALASIPACKLPTGNPLADSLNNRTNTSDGVSDSTLESPSELAIAVWAGAAQMSSGTQLSDLTCPTVYQTECSNDGVRTLALNGCTTSSGGLEAKWNGFKIVNFTPADACLNFPFQKLPLVMQLPDSGAMVIRYSSAIRSITNGRSLIVDSRAGGISLGFVVNSGERSRILTIPGLTLGTQDQTGNHKQSVDVRSTTVTQIDGSLRQNQTLSIGSMEIANTAAKWTAVTKISAGSPLIIGASCAFPTQGAVISSYQGSISGTEKLEFTGECGVAILTPTKGDPKKIQLQHLL